MAPERQPRVGDTVLFEGRRATVTRVYRTPASYIPSDKVLPVDLSWPGPPLAGDATMVGHGLNSGWSWPLPDGVPADEQA